MGRVCGACSTSQVVEWQKKTPGRAVIPQVTSGGGCSVQRSPGRPRCVCVSLSANGSRRSVGLPASTAPEAPRNNLNDAEPLRHVAGAFPQ